MSGPERIWLGCTAGEIADGEFAGASYEMDGWAAHHELEDGAEWIEGPHEYVRADLHQSTLRAAREDALREAAKAILPDDDMTWRGSWYEPALRAGQARILALIPKDGEKP